MNSLDFSRLKILVVGDVILDQYHFGKVDRISPEAPVPVVLVDNTKLVIGGAGNVANNIANLGAQAILIARVGDDINGKLLKKLLDESKIQSDFIVNYVPTILKTRIIGDHQQIVRMDTETIYHLSEEETQKFKESFTKYVGNMDAVVISDFGKGFINGEISQFIIQASSKLNKKVFIDPKFLDWSIYNGAYMVTPNLKEFSSVVGRELQNDDLEIEYWGKKVIKKYDIDYLLVTRSDKGMSLISHNQCLHVPTMVKEVFDVSGAGDTVVATISTFISNGIDLAESIKLSNRAAGIVVSKIGTSTVSADELIFSCDNRKLVSLQELLVLLRKYKKRNKKVVFTNGCFDILHKGHIYCLTKAKEFGDILIVGLNSDISVKRNKGTGRPIINEHDRAFLLVHLEIIDHVIIFNEDTPYELLSRIRPDILIKGGDYKHEEIIGKKFAVETHVIPILNGYSTSKIIESINKSMSD